MKNRFIPLMLLVTGFGLTACSSTTQPMANAPAATTTASNATSTASPIMGQPADNRVLTATNSDADSRLGGDIASGMDKLDRNKLSHALDGAIGKTISWTNSNTGIRYTVTPTARITVGINPYCRKYTITASRHNSTRQAENSACINANSNWQPS